MYSNNDFPNLINKSNQSVHIKPYGTFIVGSGHRPKEPGKPLFFYAWIVKAPTSFKKSLPMPVVSVGNREKVINYLIEIISESSAKVDDMNVKNDDSHSINGLEL